MKYFGMTDRGLVRRNNQDSYVIAVNGCGDVFALVCDGIGGNQGGDIASRMAVARLSREFAETEEFTDRQSAKVWLNQEIQAANQEIFTMGQTHAELKGMGTTLTGVLIDKAFRLVVNVGDSRVYSWHGGDSLKQLTMDHTLLNDMLLHGQLKQDEIGNFKQKNVLVNALGVWESVRADIDTHNEDLDGFLLCSDGLHSYVGQDIIQKIVLNEESDPALRCRALIREALQAGGVDNVTAVLIDLENGERTCQSGGM